MLVVGSPQQPIQKADNRNVCKDRVIKFIVSLQVRLSLAVSMAVL
jgi:hypothetical protein